MMRYILMALVLGSLAVNVSCGSKKKKADGATAPDASVSSQDMNFNPEGSDSGQIVGLSTVKFEYDRATLTSSTRKLLSDNANWMREKNDVTVQIEGHCDKRGSVEYNLALGERRAKAVKNYLVSLGVPAGRMTIISYGKEKPVASGDSETAFSKNRRANFVPLPQ